MSAPIYPLILDDGGRNLSLRPGQSNDCIIRAFSIVTDLDYDLIYDTFARSGRKPCQGYDSPAWLKRRKGRAFGGRFTSLKVRGMTPLAAGLRYPKGRYLLETDDHVWALIDGRHHDLLRIGDTLTGAWRYRLS